MQKFFSRITHLRNRHFFLLDLILLSGSPVLALILRVDGLSHWSEYAAPLAAYIALTVLVRLIAFYLAGIYARYWLYASIDELFQIVLTVAVSSIILIVIYYVANLALAQKSFLLPRSLPFIDALLVLLLVGGSRFSLRLVSRWERRFRPRKRAERVFVVGAGGAGSMIVRELRSNPGVGMRVVGFIDDNDEKLGVRIHGVPVLGNREALPELLEEYHIQKVIIAMPTVPGKVIREIVARCEKAGARAKIIPGMYELLDGTVNVKQIRDVQIEDLLRREPIQTDTNAVTALLNGARVLITGGGGSIGSEICRQIARCEPSELIIVGHGENSVFAILNELRSFVRKHGISTRIVAHIADIRFADRIHAIFAAHRPDVVFHAAAHKHVPLMELNPCEAVTNNVEGTRNILDAAVRYDVERFVMISTDKAVNPTNIMGATKRTAEYLVHQAAEKTGRPYATVRFGNVLGSRGSVVLTFQQQIAMGGPVTVTHEEMMRYFMTIPEAVQLVLQAAVLGCGGEVFVLDMGEPVRIVDMARDLIELSGLEVGEDIEIVYSGLRPGEKLFEELFVEGESYIRTRHQTIYVAENASRLVPVDLDESIDRLVQAAYENNGGAIRGLLKHLIPEYTPSRPELPPLKESEPEQKPRPAAVREAWSTPA